MQTIIHTYSLDLTNSLDKVEYNKILENFKTDGRSQRKVMISKKNRYCDFDNFDNGSIVKLQTNFLFSNQWHTICGHRVFDWFEEANENNTIKRGHYLDITPAMIMLREIILICGFCGRFSLCGDFCMQCIGSEYLKQSELYLLRLKPASLYFPIRESLSDDENLAAWHQLQFVVDNQTNTE